MLLVALWASASLLPVPCKFLGRFAPLSVALGGSAPRLPAPREFLGRFAPLSVALGGTLFRCLKFVLNLV